MDEKRLRESNGRGVGDLMLEYRIYSDRGIRFAGIVRCRICRIVS